jgi:hypothetical protein
VKKCFISTELSVLWDLHFSFLKSNSNCSMFHMVDGNKIVKFVIKNRSQRQNWITFSIIFYFFSKNSFALAAKGVIKSMLRNSESFDRCSLMRQ